MIIQNPFMLIVAVLQFVAASYAVYYGDYKLGVVNLGVGCANLALSIDMR